MGLDMYAHTLKAKPATPVDFPVAEGASDGLHYWRKHPNLHGWMQQLYVEKGGNPDPDAFNCVPVELTAEDLDRLEQDVNNGDLPDTSGFFFGQSSDERDDDLEFIAKARAALQEGAFVFYTSWW